MERGKRILIDEDDNEEPIQIGGENIPDDNTMSMCLIGKLWTERTYNTFALMETMKKLWCPVKGMTCSDLGNQMIAFQFNTMRDMKRVKDMEPWHFNKHVLVLKQITKDIQPSAMRFNAVPIWIRIYDLPISGRDMPTLKQIGARVGEVLDIDKNTTSSITRSIRMKVEIQLDKPLRRGIKVRIGSSEPCWLPIAYERLPSFCYCCGKLGHTHKDCDQLEESEDDVKEDKLPYGDFMRASPMKIVNIMVEKEGQSRDALRKSLFSSKEKNDNHLEEGNEGGKQSFEPHETDSRVSDLLDSLEKFKVGESARPGHTPGETKLEKNKEIITKVHLLKQNSLHPTTKTLTSTINPKPTKIATHPLTNPTKEPNETTNHPAAKSTTKTPELKTYRHDTNKQEAETEEKPTLQTYLNGSKCTYGIDSHYHLTPIEELRNMVQPTKLPTNKSHSPPTVPSPNLSTGNLPTKPQKSQKPETTSYTKPKTWSRITLKTPKVEGESVQMGKRNSEAAGATPRLDKADMKRSRGGQDSTSVSTAEAGYQPRRAL